MPKGENLKAINHARATVAKCQRGHRFPPRLEGKRRRCLPCENYWRRQRRAALKALRDANAAEIARALENQQVPA